MPLKDGQAQRYRKALQVAVSRIEQTELIDDTYFPIEVVSDQPYPEIQRTDNPANQYWKGFANGVSDRLRDEYDDLWSEQVLRNGYSEYYAVGYESGYWLMEMKYDSDSRYNPPIVEGVDSEPVRWRQINVFTSDRQ